MSKRSPATDPNVRQGPSGRLLRFASKVEISLERYRTTSPRTKRIAFTGAVLLIITGTVFSIQAHPEVMASLDWKPVLVVFALVVPAMILINVLVFIMTAALVGHRVEFGTALKITILGSLANMLPLPGGIAVRIAGLKTFGASWRESAAAMLCVTAIWAGVAFAFSGLWIVGGDTAPNWIGAVFTSIGVLGLIGGLAIGRSIHGGLGVSLIIGVLKTVMVVTEALRFYFCLLALGVAAGFSQAAVFVVAGVVGSAVSLVPSGLGVRETVAAGLAPLVGLSVGSGFLAATLGWLLGLTMISFLAGLVVLWDRRSVSASDVSPTLSYDERQALHGEAYVARFAHQSKITRLQRMGDLFDLPDAATVLDIGCGSGQLLELLHERVSAYNGVDFSPQFIKAAEESAKEIGRDNAFFHCEPIETYCARHPQTFDAAFALDISEHVYDPEWLEILRAIRGALKPGGRLYIHTPNAGFVIEMMKQRNFLLKQFPEHVAVRNQAANIALLREAGFDIVGTHDLAHYNILKTLHLFSRLPIIGQYLKARLFIVAVRPTR